jgi:hypothetical protein
LVILLLPFFKCTTLKLIRSPSFLLPNFIVWRSQKKRAIRIAPLFRKQLSKLQTPRHSGFFKNRQDILN